MTTAVLKSAKTEFTTRTGITAKDREKIADLLGVVLADTYMLFIKTQGLHWNVSGPNFYGVHKLTEAQYENMYEAIDVIAERIRALGTKAPASYTKYGELSAIKDTDTPKTVVAQVKTLIKDHEMVVTNMRAAAEAADVKHDLVTADLLTGRMAWHEQAVWMLTALTSE